MVAPTQLPAAGRRREVSRRTSAARRCGARQQVRALYRESVQV